MESIIFIGIQASGKSTFYKEYFFNTHIRISNDLFKTKNREILLFEYCKKTQMSFVIDNTNEDAHRNALNAHCYWMLRKEGMNEREATKYIEKKSIGDKNELLFSHGINFDKLPNWQKRGIGLYWTKEERTGYNPKNNIEVKTERNKIKIDYDLPMRDEYSNYIGNILENGKSGHSA